MFSPNQVNEIDIKTAEDGTIVRVLELKELKGSADPKLAEALFFAQQAGMTLKFIEITLENSKFQIEPGSLYFMKGKLELSTGTNGGILKGLMRSALTSETFFINTVKGTGTIYLEPTFGHYILQDIKGPRQELVADRGIFRAGSGSLSVKAERVKSLTGAIMGGEGLFQTKIEGTGIAVMFSPVPQSELVITKLEDETLQVDGDFALMRTASVSFEVQKSTKSLFGSAMSGEGLLNVYKGTGRVWLAPTQGVYEQISINGLAAAALGGKNRNTATETRGG